MLKVLVTDTDMPSFEIEEAVLEPLGAMVKLSPSSDEKTLAAEASDSAAIMAGYAPIGEPVIAAAARGGCRAIVRYGIGYDNVDVAAAERHGIPVANVPDYCSDEVADHTIALLLAHARRIVAADQIVRSGGWDIPKGNVPRLAGRCLGLLGFGRIGRRVAARALTFGLEVAAFDPVAPVDMAGVTPVTTAAELYAMADYLSLHLPLRAETRHVIDEASIRQMKRKPLLINTARGGLVDIDAVVRALDSGDLVGVALDVFETEPLPDGHPIRVHPKAVLTPHMSYYSNESEPDLIKRVAEEVARALKGEPLLNPLTKIRVAEPHSSKPGA